MRTIYKFKLKATDRQDLALPKDSIILSVIEQRDEIVIYALVESEERETEVHEVFIVGTGHPARHIWEDDDLEFLGTVKIMMLVFHIFVKYKAQGGR